MNREGPYTSQTMVALHVQALEGPGGDPTGGTATITMVPELRHAHASGKAVPPPMDRQVQPGNGYVTKEDRGVSVSEIMRY